VAGLALHAAALHSGALAVVQPLLVTGVAFALPLRALLDQARPSAGQALAAALLAAGVAIFVSAAHPSAGQPAPDAGAAASVIAAGAMLAGACSVVAKRARSGRLAGFALGLAAGILYGLVGGVLKAAVHAAIHRPAAAVTGWPLWTLAVLGTWAVVVHQRAYTHAPLRMSLPAMSVANPLAGMVFGATVFREKPASGQLAILAEALGLAVIVASVTMLARPDRGAGKHRRHHAGGASDRRDRPRGGNAESAHAASFTAESAGTARDPRCNGTIVGQGTPRSPTRSAAPLIGQGRRSRSTALPWDPRSCELRPRHQLGSPAGQVRPSRTVLSTLL